MTHYVGDITDFIDQVLKTAATGVATVYGTPAAGAAVYGAWTAVDDAIRGNKPDAKAAAATDKPSPVKEPTGEGKNAGTDAIKRFGDAMKKKQADGMLTIGLILAVLYFATKGRR